MTMHYNYTLVLPAYKLPYKHLPAILIEINPDWLPILKPTAMLLNEYRELAHLASHIEPDLQQHGAPTVDWATDMDALKITPKDAISANDFQLTLLELIAFTMSDPSLEPQADQLAIDKLAKTLSKQQAKLGKAVQELQSKKDLGSNNINIESNDLKDDDLQSVDLDDSDLENVDSKSDDIENIDLDDNNAEHELHEQLTTLLYISEFATPLLDKKKSKKKKPRRKANAG